MENNISNNISKSEIDVLTDNRYNIFVYDEIASTNDALKQLAVGGAKDNTVIIANKQTKGKGRHGRSFFSPDDTGIYFSILLKRDFSPEKAMMLTPTAAVCVAKAIEKHVSQPVKIKWVNDIYIDNKKVCGILSESSFSFDNTKTDFNIIGIGINVSKPKQDFPEEIRTKAGVLFNNEKTPDNIKNRLIADILNEFSLLIDSFDNEYIYINYVKRSWLDNKSVIADTGGETFEGVVVGIDKSMQLLVRKSDGNIVAMNSGEVNIKIL